MAVVVAAEMVAVVEIEEEMVEDDVIEYLNCPHFSVFASFSSSYYRKKSRNL